MQTCTLFMGNVGAMLELQLGSIVRDIRMLSVTYIDHRVFVNVHRLLSENQLATRATRLGRTDSPYEEDVLDGVAENRSISVRRIEQSLHEILRNYMR